MTPFVRVHVLQKYVGQSVHVSYGGRNNYQVTLFLLESAYEPFRRAVCASLSTSSTLILSPCLLKSGLCAMTTDYKPWPE